jgi:curved DNA-binding protein
MSTRAIPETFYETLEVLHTASKADIKKAYRKLAGIHHPDKNAGSARSELAFKKLTRAYAVLSDDRMRALYDEFGEEGLRSGFDTAKARTTRAKPKAHEGPEQRDPVALRRVCFEDLTVRPEETTTTEASALDVLGGFLGRRSKVPAADYSTALEIELFEALRGTVIVLESRRAVPIAKVFVAPGTLEGAVLRVPDLGAPGVNGALSGDLLITLHVKSHPFFKREGELLTLELPITASEAYFGARVSIPTVDGNVAIKIPPRSQSGHILRVRGKGIPKATKGIRGDLLVKLQVHIPTADAKELEACMETLRKWGPTEIRASLRTLSF